jgi:Na+-driven multidrug efflux pump
MYVALGTAAFNALLDPFLIFGWGPFPELGVAGAALATVVMQTIGAAFYLIYLPTKRSPYRIRLGAMLPRWPVIYDIYHVGLPAIVMMLIGSIVIVFYNQFLRPFGTVAIAAYGLLFRIVQLFLLPIVGMSQGLMPIVGYNFGAKNLARMWAGVRIASIYATVVTGFAELLLLTLAGPLVAVFARTAELLATASYAIRVFSVALVFVGAQFMWITTLQGMGRGRDALVLSFMRQVIFLVPLMWLFSSHFGLTGIWAAQPVSDVLAFIVTAVWIWHVCCRIGAREPGPPAASESG